MKLSTIIVLIALLVGSVKVYNYLNPKRFTVDETAPLTKVVWTTTGVTETAFNPAKRYLVAYYTASWCPPCRQFTPEFVKFLSRVPHDKFDVVIVSRDRSERDMVEYMKHAKFTWGGLSPERSQGFLQSPPSETGIPNLVIIDQMNGGVVMESYVNGNYQGPMRVLQHLDTLIRQP